MVLRRVHGLAMHPPSHIPQEISSPKQELNVAKYTHHTMAVQMRRILMCPQSTQTSGVIVVVPPFQLGCVYQPEDLGLSPLDPQHAHPSALLMLHMSILSPVDLSMGDLVVATPYHLLKEALFTLEIITQGEQQRWMKDEIFFKDTVCSSHSSCN